MPVLSMFKGPKAVYSGEGALEKLPALLAQTGARQPVLITDEGVEKAGLLQEILSCLQGAGFVPPLFDALPAEPAYQQVQEVAQAARAAGADLIIAVGGGSVMDAAKLSAVLLKGEYTVKDLLKTPSLAKKGCPTIMIPTTAGTGAEVTPNAIVAVPEEEIKVGIVNDALIGDYVLLCPGMIRRLPRKIAAATGVDALAHAIECYTGNKATPLSDLFALEALDLLLNNLLAACDSEEEIGPKTAVQLASFYAGLAITASGTTAVHALSYPLGGKYHIAHGVSNAILLAPVMRFNEPACREKLAAAYDRCCRVKACQSEAEKSAFMIRWLEVIVRRLDIPASLKEFGVPQEDLPSLAKAAMQVQRLLTNNKRPVTEQDALALYRQVF